MVAFPLSRSWPPTFSQHLSPFFPPLYFLSAFVRKSAVVGKRLVEKHVRLPASCPAPACSNRSCDYQNSAPKSRNSVANTATRDPILIRALLERGTPASQGNHNQQSQTQGVSSKTQSRSSLQTGGNRTEVTNRSSRRTLFCDDFVLRVCDPLVGCRFCCVIGGRQGGKLRRPESRSPGSHGAKSWREGGG
jgi:hypothetical protein